MLTYGGQAAAGPAMHALKLHVAVDIAEDASIWHSAGPVQGSFEGSGTSNGCHRLPCQQHAVTAAW